jgi:hypothetical protein
LIMTTSLSSVVLVAVLVVVAAVCCMHVAMSTASGRSSRLSGTTCSSMVRVTIWILQKSAG